MSLRQIVFILINNQLLNTVNAEDINTNWNIKNSCLIKTGIMRMFGIGCYYFFEMVWKYFVSLKNYPADFQESGFKGRPAAPLCACILFYPVFTLSHFREPLEFLTQIFEFFLFSHKLPTQVSDFGFIG